MGYRCSGVRPELLCVTDEPVKLRDIKVVVLEEYHAQVQEYRGIDSGDETLQVITAALKFQPGESGEDKGGERRRKLSGDF